MKIPQLAKDYLRFTFVAPSVSIVEYVFAIIIIRGGFDTLTFIILCLLLFIYHSSVTEKYNVIYDHEKSPNKVMRDAYKALKK